jgi:hypothetical protein
MGKLRVLLLIFLPLLCAAQNVSAQYKIDSVAITSLITDDYNTLANFDTIRHRRNCTYDYKLVEDGDIWSIDREMAYIASMANTKQTRKNQFEFKYVTVYSTTGYAVYTLRSVIRQPDGKEKKYYWLETAILRKIANQWKIALIHSTQLKE